LFCLSSCVFDGELDRAAPPGREQNAASALIEAVTEIAEDETQPRLSSDSGAA
jgi:hypothetical protein